MIEANIEVTNEVNGFMMSVPSDCLVEKIVADVLS
jgi:hypothetical protein